MIKTAHIVAPSILLASLLVTGRAEAAAKEFDFKDPKGVNSIVFVLDSLLEPIMGVGSGISGKVNFDPENPKSLAGKIVLDTNTLHVANKGMKDTMLGSDWLDVQANPTVTFEIKEVKEAAKNGDAQELTVDGNLTLKGVTKPITAKITATYLPDKMQDRMRGAKGDLLVLRSKFSIKRADFNIKPDMGSAVVAEEVELRVSITGGHKAG